MESQDEWYEPFESKSPIYEWAERGNNWETALVFLWDAWVLGVVGLGYAVGGEHREGWWKNWRLLLVVGGLIGLMTFILMAAGVGLTGCVFKVNCGEAGYAQVKDHWVNWLLFEWDEVGGQWDGVVPSTVFPWYWRFVVFVTLVGASVVHHLGVDLIVASKPASPAAAGGEGDDVTGKGKSGFVVDREEVQVFGKTLHTSDSL